MKFLYVYFVVMREDMTFSDSGLLDQWAKDIQHVQERPDGSSDWLHEALDYRFR